MKKNIIDRTSELPECIAHHILSYLDSPAELVRTSVLSKQWFAQTASFPILDFNFYKFCKVTRPFTYIDEVYNDGYGYTRDNYFKYVVYTMSRFCKQNVSAHTFKLKMAHLDPIQVDIINKWIGVIFKNGVQVLEFEVFYCWPRPMYVLPNTLLLSASSLTSLKLRSCDLPSSLMIDAVKFKSLKLLHLFSVCLGDEMIKYLTSCCPLLEEFYVEDCRGFKRFSVLGHQNLRKVQIRYPMIVERIDIEAPNLCKFSLTVFKGNWENLNLSSCKKLTRLHYESLTSDGFRPFLEHLTFVLHSDCHVDSLWFQQLRRFLEKNNGFKELTLCISVKETADDFEELKMIQSQPFELEHVDLEPQYFKNLAAHESVVDAVLWCCRPRSLTLQSYFSNIDFEEWSHLLKFTYEKLREQEEDEGHTNIRIILPSNPKIHFSDLNSLLKSLPCDEIEDNITFIKEQVV